MKQYIKRNETISVIVSSRNRPAQLAQSIRSILDSNIGNSEVIIIDQSDYRSKIYNRILSPKNNGYNIRYFHQPAKGLSLARNTGIRLATSGIVSFTDDDCLLDKYWINNIIKTFHEHPDVAGIFGKTLPFGIGDSEKTCPCCFNPGKQHYIISKPTKHWESIGFGNNMAFRKDIFSETGYFKLWLGIKSVGLSAEDAEFVNRILIHGYKIIYNPDMIVYHNKWLVSEQMENQQLSYTCGEMACYGYFAFQGYSFAKPVVWNNIHDIYYRLRKICKKILECSWGMEITQEFKWFLLNALYRTRGLLIGIFYSFIDPIKK